MTDRPRFNLTIRADHALDDDSDIRALRALLKRLARAYGFRVERITPAAEKPKGAA